jgi:GPH family glycoside/pentoside/hexuronide:cation symporter
MTERFSECASSAGDPLGVRSGVRLEVEHVPLRTVLSYGPPILGLSSLLFFIQFYFLKFATDVLLLAPAAVSLIFGLGRVWDAFSDPIAGTLSDRTRSRLGRRRPWLFAAIPILGLGFAMTWMPPAAVGSIALYVWAGLALFVFYSGYTAYAIPHASLGAELTPDHHERTRIFGVRHASFMAGIVLAFAGMQFVENAEDSRAAAASLAWAVIPVMAVVLFIPGCFVKERPDYSGRGGRSSFRAMADVLRNRHARLLLAVTFVEIAGTSVLGIVAPYMIVYVLKRPDLIGPLPGLFLASSIVAIPLWVRASKRFGKRDVWMVAMVGLAAPFGASFFVGEGDVALLAVLFALAGIAAGCGGTIGFSMLADVIDYDEYRSGERKEGVYAAAQGFATKAANTTIILLTGMVLQLSGFVPNVDQTPTAKLAISSLLAGVPFSMFLLGAALLSRVRLDSREHARIRAELIQEPLQAHHCREKPSDEERSRAKSSQ